MELCNLSVVRGLLEKYGCAPKKGYGQNFLINPMIPIGSRSCHTDMPITRSPAAFWRSVPVSAHLRSISVRHTIR